MELPAPDVEGYKGGNVNACYDQLVAFIMANPQEEGDDDSDVARAFAFEIAAKVGFQYCTHDSAPEPLQDMGLQNRKHAASDHPGLCGYYHAGVIAAVKTEDVQAKWGSTTGNKFRNQACFDGAMTMNARGKGVQLKRCDCFTHACRALWPGSGEMEPCVVDAFSR